MTTPTETESIIYEVLQDRLRTLPSSPPVAWPGVDFVVPNDRVYLRVEHLPNQTQRVVIDSDGPSRHMGILQVTVVRPASDGGDLSSKEQAGKVASHFSPDTKMVSGSVVVRSTRRPTVAPSMRDGADILTPVSVEYETYI